jgi:hypothetical protein
VSGAREHDGMVEELKAHHGTCGRGFLAAVGEFYREPEGGARGSHIFSLLALGWGALVAVSLMLPHFAPSSDDHAFFYSAVGLTVSTAVLSVLRKERGLLGAAAAVVGACAGVLGLFFPAFGLAAAWIIDMFMGD